MRPDAAVHWLWSATSVPAQVARASLLPAAAAYATYTRLRAGAYQHGMLRRHDVAVPTIAVGNLSVGGTGKTPIASWIAARCATLGVVPGIVLRGYGRDEAAVHQERVPGAIVIPGRNRPRAARRAVSLGAAAVVLDDGFQRLDLGRDLNVLLMSADSGEIAPWTLPAGPWREPPRAVRRADLVVVTRKQAPAADADGLGERLTSFGFSATQIAVAHLRLDRLTELLTHRPADPGCLRGARVLAACAIADPVSFAYQLTSLGADVRLATWRDHHAYAAADVRGILSTTADVDYVVVTHKDAVKLRGLWPHPAPGPLVAHLEVEWERGGEVVADRISDLLTGHYAPGMY